MSNIWILAPLFLLGVVILLVYFFSRKRSQLTEDDRHPEHYELAEDVLHPDLDVFNETQSRSAEPIKIERKKKPKNILNPAPDLPARGDHEKFIEEFDRRDAVRKKLQKENEEKLKSLLSWRSPDFKRNTKYEIDSLVKKRTIDFHPAEKKSGIKGPEVSSRKTLSVIQGDNTGEGQVNIKRERHKKTEGEIKSCKEEEEKGPGVTKIINFVKIRTQQAVPDYKPRNKLTGSKTGDLPQKVERKRRAPTPSARKKVKVNIGRVCEVSEKVEDVDCIDVPSPEARAATVNITERH